MSGTIVVGVDGSDESKLALRWALDEARLRGAKLRCIHVWHYPAMVGTEGLPLVAGEFFDAVRDDARALLAGAVSEVAGEAGGVEIETSIEQGPAASALVVAAEGADLLVLGSRGRGGFSGLLLGSVSQQCAHHALCPVVIVPSKRSD